MEISLHLHSRMSFLKPKTVFRFPVLLWVSIIIRIINNSKLHLTQMQAWNTLYHISYICKLKKRELHLSIISESKPFQNSNESNINVFWKTWSYLVFFFQFVQISKEKIIFLIGFIILLYFKQYYYNFNFIKPVLFCC